MKRKLFSILFILFLISTNYAMPPHPRVLQEYEENNSASVTSRQLTSYDNSKNQAVKSFPSTGINKVLILIVGFSDIDLDVGSSEVFYDDLFTNGPGGNGLSWKKYYQDMSNNNLTLDFDIFDVGIASDTHQYYGDNISPDGDDAHPGQLIAEAVAAGDAAGIDYSLYDNDADGYVDAVIVIHQGQSEEYTGSSGIYSYNIWSHRWNLYSENIYNNGNAGYSTFATDSDNDGILEYDNVLINDYAIQPEYNAAVGDSTIGVFVHEFGHILGLPDLYDTSNSSDGIGNWGLMAGGSWLGSDWLGTQPAPMTAWSRANLGWLTVETAKAKNIFPTTVRNSTSIPIRFIIFLLVLGGVQFFILKKYKFIRYILIVLFMTIIPLSTCKKEPSINLVSFNLAETETSYKAEQIVINSNEYLLVENKVKSIGTWTEYLPGQGLLIYHVDNNLITDRYSTNTINDFSINGQFGIKLVEADSNSNLSDPDDGDSGSATDPFYLGNVDSVNNYTANSGESAQFEISNIGPIGSVISFDIFFY